MKINYLFILFISLPVAAWAADVIPAPAADEFDWKSYIIPILGPSLVMGVKKLTPKIPNVILPWLALVLGPILDLLLGLLPVYESSPTVSIALGAAIIGTRELWDQTKQALAGHGGTPETSQAYENNIASGAITKDGIITKR